MPSELFCLGPPHSLYQPSYLQSFVRTAAKSYRALSNLAIPEMPTTPLVHLPTIVRPSSLLYPQYSYDRLVLTPKQFKLR